MIGPRHLPTQQRTLLVLAATAFFVGFAFWVTMTLVDRSDTLERSKASAMRGAMLLEGQMELLLMAARGMTVETESRSQEVARTEATDGGQASGMLVLGPDGQVLDDVPVALDGVLDIDGTVALGEVNGQRTLFVVRAFKSGGKALIALPMMRMEALLQKIREDWGGILGLFWKDGTKIIGFGADYFPDIKNHISGAGEFRESSGLNGESALVAFRPLEKGSLYAVLGVSHKQFLTGWLNRSIRGGVIFLFAVGTMGAMAWIGHRSLRREARMRFELVDANHCLECRVEERTAELSAANRDLQRALDDKDRANQAKSRFLAAANHDLRQPFQSLRLFHHLLGRRLKDQQDLALLDKMGDALEGGEKLLHSLLEVATLDAGAVRPQLEDFLIDEALTSVAEAFAEKAVAKGLRLRVRHSGMMVRTDRALLMRMLSDLVSNAITYTSEGGVLVGCRRTGGELRVEVWDSGAGIPEDQHASIFEDFVQLGNPERNSSHGLGLGLAKFRRKAELLNHPVSLRSRLHRGSVFAITLPLVPDSKRAGCGMDCTVEGQSAAAARTLLLVEDDACQRSGLILLLEEWGYHVTSAVDGDDALAVLAVMTTPPDLVLTDFRMPGTLNGVDVVGAVQAELRRKIPGIIMTGDTAPEIIRDAINAGCRLLHKPYSPAGLQAILQATDKEISSARTLQQTAA